MDINFIFKSELNVTLVYKKFCSLSDNIEFTVDKIFLMYLIGKKNANVHQLSDHFHITLTIQRIQRIQRIHNRSCVRILSFKNKHHINFIFIV
jgi:hypothetical protein